MWHYPKHYHTCHIIFHHRKSCYGGYPCDVSMYHDRKYHSRGMCGTLRKKCGKAAGFPVSIAIGAILKALFMGIAIALIILPSFLPAPMHKMLPVLQLQFSVTQLITAVIGGVYAVIIAAVLKKTSLAQAD